SLSGRVRRTTYQFDKTRSHSASDTLRTVSIRAFWNCKASNRNGGISLILLLPVIGVFLRLQSPTSTNIFHSRACLVMERSTDCHSVSIVELTVMASRPHATNFASQMIGTSDRR